MKGINGNIVDRVLRDIEYIDNNGIEYWYASDLMQVLQYENWNNFRKNIEKAKSSCDLSGNKVDRHFIKGGKKIIKKNNKEIFISDLILSRFAVYLTIMNCDPKKDIVGKLHNYFIRQTLRSEEIEVRCKKEIKIFQGGLEA